MTRMFDANQESRKQAEVRAERAAVRQRYEAVNKMVNEELGIDATVAKIHGHRLAAPSTIETVHYTSFRPVGSRWMIEHAKAFDDYVYQMFPLRPTKLSWQDVIIRMIAAMDVIFPRSVIIRYAPPNEEYEIKFYTIKVEKVVAVPGWENACTERALANLVTVDAWPVSVQR